MAVPIQTQITRNIVGTLKTVTKQNGYGNTLIVERPNPSLGNRERDSLCIVVPQTPARVGTAPMSHVEWDMPYAIVCIVVESDQSDVTLDERLDSIRADVEKALTYQTHTRGNLAIDTIVDDPDYEIDGLDAHMAYVTVNLHVKFRTLYNDPFNQ